MKCTFIAWVDEGDIYNVTNNNNNEMGNTPIYIASGNGHAKIVRVLLDNRADVNIPNNCASTPLHAASCCDSTDVIKLLLEHGGRRSINHKNRSGRTPLFLASIHGNANIAKLQLSWQKMMKSNRYSLNMSHRCQQHIF